MGKQLYSSGLNVSPLTNSEDVLFADGSNLSDKINNVKQKNIVDDESNSLSIADADGNVVAIINKDGVKSVDFLNAEGESIIQDTPSSIPDHPLKGKQIWSLGDSLCTGKWEQYLADQSGAVFNKDMNNNISCGGAGVVDKGGPVYGEQGWEATADIGATRRIKNFLLVPGQKDYLFLENVHDFFKGNLNPDNYDIGNYDPLMWTQYKVLEDIDFEDIAEAKQYFHDNFSTLVSTSFSVRKPCSIIKMKIRNMAKYVWFSGTPNDGNVVVTINGQQFSTSISSGDTLSQAVDKINVWAFADYTAWKNYKFGSRVLVISYVGGNGGSIDDEISVDCGTTGLTYEITENTYDKAEGIMFKSLDITNWENESYWKGLGTSMEDEISAWKGVIEYVQKESPNTKLVMLLFPNTSTNDNWKRADGSWDVDSWKKATSQSSHAVSRKMLRKVAEYYNIPVIDVEGMCGVMTNWQTFFNPNDVHFSLDMHKRIATIIYNNISY